MLPRLSCSEVVESRRVVGSIVPSFASFDRAFAALPFVSSDGGLRFYSDPVVHDACLNSSDLYAYLVANEPGRLAWTRTVLARVGL